MSVQTDKNPGAERANPSGSDDPAHKQRRHLSVVLKLTLLFGFTFTVLLSTLLTASGYYWLKARQRQMQAHLSGVATSRREIVRAEIELLRQRIELNTDRGEFRGFFYELSNDTSSAQNRDGSQVSLDQIANGKPIVTASLVNEAGIVVLSTDRAQVGRDVSRWPEFKPGLIQPYVGLPHPKKTKDRFDAVLAAPIRARSDSSRVYGILLVVADVSRLAQSIRDTTGLGETGETILGVRDDDQIRFLFPPRNAPTTHAVPIDAAPALKVSTAGAETFFENRDYRGVPVLAAGRPIGYGGWALVVKMDQKEAYASVARAQRLGILAGIIVALVGLVAAYFLALRFTRPVRRLAQAAARVTDGDYGTTVPVESADEFGALSANFNEMTAALRARRSERDKAEAALREADRRKDEFLAVLGHELRNPLSAITNAVRVIDASADDPHADEAAREIIARQTGNLVRLVDDLLDVASVSKGKIELRKKPTEIGQAILRAVEATRALIDSRGHSVDLALANGGAVWIDADPTRLDQIITNLLINAAKYTPDGGRIVVTERLDGRNVVITVRDTGIGISPDMLTQIFELFTQADRSLERRTGGLGIGLSLCRQLVELHGGTIAVHSGGLGQGATFTLTFPTVAAPAVANQPAPKKNLPAGPRRRVLLVDDNVDTIQSMSRLLTLRGHEVATAVDGLAGLQMARDFRPDFILLDIGLPGLDGYSLARRLRAEGFTNTPIVAVSGYARDDDRERSREAGFNHHFAKPVEFETLAALLAEDSVSPEVSARD